MQNVYAKKAIGITDLKRNSTDFIDNIDAPIALLKRDMIKAYLIPTSLMEYLMEKLECDELIKETNKRLKDIHDGKVKTIKVNISDL